MKKILTKAILVALWLFLLGNILPKDTLAYFDNSGSISNNTFTATCWEIPSVPTPSLPVSNSYLSVNNLTFSWSGSNTSCPTAALSYQFRVFTDAGLTSLYSDSGWIFTTSVSLTSLPENNYYWQVRAKDQFNHTSNFSTTRLATIDRTAPIANAGADQTKDTSQNVTFDGLGSTDATSGIASYKWDKDASDGTNFVTPDLTGTNPTLVGGYAVAGVYTVTLQVTDNVGLTSTDTITVTVTPPAETVTVRLFPAADSYLSSKSSETNTNYGNSTDMKVKAKTGELRRSILSFDLSTLPSGSIINSCNLKLYMSSAPNSSRTYGVHRLSSFENTWTETGVTWNNYKSGSAWGTAGGDFNAGATATAATGTTNNVTLSWNVTGDCSLATRSWIVKDESEGANYEGIFQTKDGSVTAKYPYLEVNYTIAPVSTSYPVINEVYYDVAASGKGVETTNEWVEIYNPTSLAVDISGWKICDNTSCRDIPASSSVPAWGFAVLTPDISTWGYWSIPAGASKIVLGGSIGGGLSNTGDRVILQNTSSAEIDKMSYGTDPSAFTLPVIDEGWSFARLIKGFDTNSASDFWANSSPNPGINPPLELNPPSPVLSETLASADVATITPTSTPTPTPASVLLDVPAQTSTPSLTPTSSPTPTPTLMLEAIETIECDSVTPTPALDCLDESLNNGETVIPSEITN